MQDGYFAEIPGISIGNFTCQYISHSENMNIFAIKRLEIWLNFNFDAAKLKESLSVKHKICKFWQFTWERKIAILLKSYVSENKN